MAEIPDAIVIGSGPNGLSAAIALSAAGYSVEIYEGAQTVGGGLRSHQALESGFIHDECSAIHPMGILSPFFQTLALEEHGLTWCSSDISVAHPLDDVPAALLYRDFTRTAETLGTVDGAAWERMFAPLSRHGGDLLVDLMGPFNPLPRRFTTALRFALLAHQSATTLAQSRFESVAGRALFAGLSGHSILPLEMRLTAAFGLIFGVTAALTEWPCAQGGSQSIAAALSSKFLSLGGVIHTNRWVDSLADLPEARAILLDVSPHHLARIAKDSLPEGYVRRLGKYKYGPGTFKMDYTLDGPIPWKDPNVSRASTVHVGGTLEEIAASERAAWRGEAPSSPYLILCQQSELDPSRAPSGKHTGYAYCHVPHGYSGDAAPLIEAQIERFAPGFRDLIRERKSTSPREFEALNPNFIGGAVTGGAATLDQLFTRPVVRLDPYSTPNPRIFLCSASTPPGGGVHGMCGYYAARSVAQRLRSKGERAFSVLPSPQANLALPNPPRN